MLKDITLGQYFPGDSAVHRADPRIKILLTVAYITAVFFIDSFTGYLVCATFTALFIGASHIPVSYVFKGLKPLFFIIVFTALINIFMTPGDEVFRIYKTNIIATNQGLMLAVFMILRLIFLIIGTSVLTLTSSPISLTDGIENLLNPFKKIGVPAHELAMMMTIAIRFIPTLLEETEKIMKAQMARGADFSSGNLFKRAKALVPLLVPLFISAFRRADELAMAMECRCYNGGVNRTRLRALKLKWLDLWVVLIFAVFFTCIMSVGFFKVI